MLSFCANIKYLFISIEIHSESCSWDLNGQNKADSITMEWNIQAALILWKSLWILSEFDIEYWLPN